MSGCYMISAKMTQPFCNPTLTLTSSNHRNNFGVPFSVIPQSKPGLIRHSHGTRLLPIIKQNSTSFQCRCTKQDTPGLRTQTMIKNVLFHINKHSLIFLIDLRAHIVSSFTYFFRSKKRKPIDLSPDELLGVDDPLSNFCLILDFLQGSGNRRHYVPRCIAIPSEGVLVYGPTGAGKTTLVHLVAQKAGVSFFPVSAIDISDTTDKWFITNLFGEARRCSPSIIFIDDVDYIASPSYDSNFNQISSEMVMCEHDGSLVLVIFATEKHSLLGSPLLNDWFPQIVYVGNPDEDSRRKFVTSKFKGALREEDTEAICNLVASQTSGLAWSFLRHIVRESRTKALTRGDAYVTMDDAVKVLEEIKKR